MVWSLKDRAADMQAEHQKNFDRDAQEAARRRMSVQRMKRAIVQDDKNRSKS
jgi:hypothetical protein